MAHDTGAIQADVVLESTDSNSCATLTPKMRGRIREMPVGGILEVRTADPSAREGVPSWCRLTGNELLAVVEDDPEITRFFIRKT
ncbi:MAG TPA: sulfurtransferase TusA family protein [Chloroflexota bacterium]|nr:sulfurtransferase TusA family protein [Chloroflexota bacterium]